MSMGGGTPQTRAASSTVHCNDAINSMSRCVSPKRSALRPCDRSAIIGSWAFSAPPCRFLSRLRKSFTSSSVSGPGKLNTTSPGIAPFLKKLLLNVSALWPISNDSRAGATGDRPAYSSSGLM